MKTFIVTIDQNLFCGCSMDYEMEAEHEGEAKELAYAQYLEDLSPFVDGCEEVTE
jgi:hypothetical protein